MSDNCWDCGHPIGRHSGDYDGSELRGVPKPWPPKRSGTGCLTPGCECRRWFEVVVEEDQ